MNHTRNIDKGISLRTSWYGLVILLTLVPLIFVAPWVGSKIYLLLLENKLLSEVTFNRNISHHIDQELNRIITLLENKSDPIAFNLSKKQDPELIHQLLEIIISREKGIKSLSLWDRDGKSLAHKHRSDKQAYPIFSQSPELKVSLSGQTYLGMPEFHEDHDIDFKLAVPVMRSKEVLASLLAIIDTEIFWDPIKNHFSRENIVTYLIDKQGNLLTQLEGGKFSQGTSMTHLKIVSSLISGDIFKKNEVYYGINGKRVFGVGTGIDKPDWYIISEIPEEEIIGPIASILYVYLGFVILMAFLLGGVGLWLVRRMLQPIREISEAFSQIASGDYIIHNSQSNINEIQMLAKGFNQMASEIQRREQELKTYKDHLEDEVKKQTEELNFREFALNEHAIVSATDKNGDLIYVNHKFCQISGYSQNELIGKNYLITKSEEHSLEFFQELWLVIREGKTWHGEIKNLTKDGEAYWIKSTIVPFSNEEENSYRHISISTDITDRKQTEEALQLSKEEAESANRAKSEFLANMSHEIRTPMNAIMGMTQLALQTNLTAKQFDFLSKVESSSKSLLKIISGILDFSKIEAGMMKIESLDFNLEDVFGRLSDIFMTQTQGKGLEFIFNLSPEVPDSLKGDPFRLGQVLINLVNNALKFTSTGKIVVSVQLEESKETGVRLQFSVQDTGIGVKPEKVSNLFHTFTQADGSTTRKYGGTGLGLAISKHLVALMGGEIWMESDYGHGSTLFFTILFDVSTQKLEGKPSFPSELKGLKVLVLSNLTSTTNRLIQYLKSFSFRYTLVSTLETILLELKNTSPKDPYKLIFLDDLQSRKNVVDALQRIKTCHEPSTTARIIILSSQKWQKIELQEEDHNFDGLLQKPLDKTIFFNTVMEIFCRRANEDAIKDDAVLEKKVVRVRKIVAGARVLLVEENQNDGQVLLELLEKVEINVEFARNGKEVLEKIVNQAWNFPNSEDVDKDNSSYDLLLINLQTPQLDGCEAIRKIRRFEKNISITKHPLGFENHPLSIVALTSHESKNDLREYSEAGMDDYLVKPVTLQLLYGKLCKWIRPSDPEIAVRKPLLRKFDFSNKDLLTKKNEGKPLQCMTEINRFTLQPLFKTLHVMLEDCDPESKKTIQLIKDHLWGSTFEGITSTLEQEIFQYNYDAAILSFNELTKKLKVDSNNL